MNSTKKTKLHEFCNECGQPVNFGSGRFVNRIIDLNTIEDKKEMRKPFPQGHFICEECDLKIRQ